MRTESNPIPSGGHLGRAWRWFIVDFLGIFREMRLNYLPPLMVYLAAGVSAFTGIIESFFVDDYREPRRPGDPHRYGPDRQPLEPAVIGSNHFLKRKA